MRKVYVMIFLAAAFSGCSNDSEIRDLKLKVEELNAKLGEYRPPIGSIMMDIQAHHTKLWLAGSQKNWKLAEFQLHEIEEAVEDIEKFHYDRPESNSVVMLDNAIDNLHDALEKQNPVAFEEGFNFLTSNCNSCHQSHNVGFNVIKVPEGIAFPNQEFTTGAGSEIVEKSVTSGVRTVN